MKCFVLEHLLWPPKLNRRCSPQAKGVSSPTADKIPQELAPMKAGTCMHLARHLLPSMAQRHHLGIKVFPNYPPGSSWEERQRRGMTLHREKPWRRARGMAQESDCPGVGSDPTINWAGRSLHVPGPRLPPQEHGGHTSPLGLSRILNRKVLAKQAAEHLVPSEIQRTLSSTGHGPCLGSSWERHKHERPFGGGSFNRLFSPTPACSGHWRWVCSLSVSPVH